MIGTLPNVVSRLSEELGRRVLTSRAAREQHGHDESHHEWGLPEAIVMCDSTETVSTAIAICAAARVPVVPFGAGTGLEGGANTPAGAISLDLSSMTRILAVNSSDLDVMVQAGVTRSQLNAALAPGGLFFPVDPGADASLGGMAATCASGTYAVRYGTMRENVLGLTAVLADGTVIHTGGRARKSSAGYDLTRLLVGSEGTLAVITEVTLRVYGIPENISAAICGYPDLHSATSMVQHAIQLAIPLARIELLDEVMVGAVNSFSGLQLPEIPTLIFEFHGTPVAVAGQVDEVRTLAAEYGGTGFAAAQSAAERAKLWQARHDALRAAKSLRPGSRTWSTDVCVPISQLAECILQTKQDIALAGSLAPIAGHVGDGNFHLAFVLPPGDDGAFAAAQHINERLVRRALDMGGTCTGEHGIGIGKLRALALEHPTAVPVMRTIKAAVDPLGILNPGKVIK